MMMKRITFQLISMCLSVIIIVGCQKRELCDVSPYPTNSIEDTFICNILQSSEKNYSYLMVKDDIFENVSVEYPRIVGMADKEKMAQLNKLIYNEVTGWLPLPAFYKIKADIRFFNNDFISISINQYHFEEYDQFTNKQDQCWTLNILLSDLSIFTIDDVYYTDNKAFIEEVCSTNYTPMHSDIISEGLQPNTCPMYACFTDQKLILFYTSNNKVNEINRISYYAEIPYQNLVQWERPWNDYCKTYPNEESQKTNLSKLLNGSPVKWERSKYNVSQNVWAEYPIIIGMEDVKKQKVLNEMIWKHINKWLYPDEPSMELHVVADIKFANSNMISIFIKADYYLGGAYVFFNHEIINIDVRDTTLITMNDIYIINDDFYRQIRKIRYCTYSDPNLVKGLNLDIDYLSWSPSSAYFKEDKLGVVLPLSQSHNMTIEFEIPYKDLRYWEKGYE